MRERCWTVCFGLLAFCSFASKPTGTVAFVVPPSSWSSSASCLHWTQGMTALRSTAEDTVYSTPQRLTTARTIAQELVETDNCFGTETGARAFGDACAVNVLYEDCYEPQPFVGKEEVVRHLTARAQQRSKGGANAAVRIDKISDGDQACGFSWTWTVGDDEGLRGTTFVELNDAKEIVYVREIPEPIYKPGDATLEVLKMVTEGAQPRPPRTVEPKSPTTANEVARYLFQEVQGSSVDEAMRFFDESIVYHDFNYKDKDVLRGRAQVRKFVEDFNLPGIDFLPQRFDDGIDATCFTWEVALEGAPETMKGISYYELNPETRLIRYVRDIPESAIKPPIFGKLARDLRPSLGVFSPVKVGSRPPI